MRGLIVRFLPILLVALLGLYLPTRLTLAADSCTTGDTWELVWDLTADSKSGTAPTGGVWTGGTGWQSSNWSDDSDFHGINVTIPVPSLTVNTIAFTYSGSLDGLGNVNWFFANFSPSYGGSGHLSVSVTIGSSNNSAVYEFGTPTLLTSVAWEAVEHDSQIQDEVLTTITFTGGGDPPEGCGESGGGLGDLTKPVKSSDLHPQWGMFDYQYVMDNDPENDGVLVSDFPDTVYAFSNKADAKVSAVAPGTVIDMKPYTGADCSSAIVVLQTLRRCYVFIPDFITQETSQFVFNIELVNIWVITVEDADDSSVTYLYWLADPVVSVGDEVVAGCLLGKTIQLKNPTNVEITGFSAGITGGASASESGDAGVSVNIGGTLNANFRSLLVNAGVTTVVAKQDGEPIQLYPFLTEEPDYSNCKASTTSNCTLDNAQLKSKNGIYPEGWGTGQSSIIEGGGVHLLQGGSLIQSNVAIRPDIGYTLSVLARVTTPIESFYPLTLKVGTATTTRNVTEGDYQLLTWQLTAREVNVTDVGVINQVDVFNSEFPVEVDIKYICFSPDTASVAPGSCYFGNHGFDADGQGWTPFGNVTFTNGQAFMGDSSLLEQGVVLLTNTDSSPATYHLKALVRLNASASYTGQIGKSVELKYAFPVSGGYTSLGVIDSTLVEAEGRNTYDGNINIEHVYQLTDDIEISTNTDGLFSFGVLVTDTDGYIKGLRIDSLCLTPDTSDGSFPGQITGGGFSPPFIEKCGVIPTPSDNNVSSWTYYHWKNLERFFDCTLMVKLNQMFSVMNDAWKTTRLFLRWCVVLVNRIGDWFTTFVWWLGGHFRNIAFGQVTTVYQAGGGQCSDLFCVLNNLITGLLNPITNIVNTLLSLLTIAVNLLLTIITGVIGLALAFLQRLLALFNQGSSLLSGILDAYNTATPTAIDGLPMCNVDPTSSLFCRATWTLDNTILSGRWGMLITLILGFLGLHLVLWVIGEVKTAIVTTGSGS